MRLAQIAFRNLPQANSERYTYDAFVQSIIDLGLHHQVLARGVTTVEGALTEEDATFWRVTCTGTAWLPARWT